MAKPHGRDDNGVLVDLIGQPMDVRPAPEPKLMIEKTEEVQPMPEAKKRRIYILDGAHFYVNGSDKIPTGAELVEEPVEERAKPAAPENKSKQSAPENRAVKKAD